MSKVVDPGAVVVVGLAVVVVGFAVVVVALAVVVVAFAVVVVALAVVVVALAVVVVALAVVVVAFAVVVVALAVVVVVVPPAAGTHAAAETARSETAQVIAIRVRRDWAIILLDWFIFGLSFDATPRCEIDVINR